MDHAAIVLKAAFDALVSSPPKPANEADAIWAGVILMQNPDAGAAELRTLIGKSDIVILRNDEDQPKLEAIVSRWKELLPKPAAKPAWKPEGPLDAERGFDEEHRVGWTNR